MDIVDYPQILTNTDWQAKKGKIAKLAGETGIGDLMKKCQAEHEKADFFNKFAATNNIDWRTVEATKSRDEVVDELEPVLMKKYMNAAAPLRKLLSELRDTAKKTAAEWKKKPLIPSSSQKHAEEVSKAADLMFMQMKETSPGVQTLFGFEKLRADLKKKREESLKVLNTQIGQCEDGLKAAIQTPTKKSWEDNGAHQGCRSVCNGMAAIAELKKQYYATWQKFGNFFCNDIPDNDPEEATKVKAKVKTVAQELIKYKAAVHKLQNG